MSEFLQDWNQLLEFQPTSLTFWRHTAEHMSSGEICFQNSCRSRFSGVHLVYEVFQDTWEPISFYKRVSGFVVFQTKVAHLCFCLVRIQIPLLIMQEHSPITSQELGPSFEGMVALGQIANTASQLSYYLILQGYSTLWVCDPQISLLPSSAVPCMSHAIVVVDTPVRWGYSGSS